MKKILCILTVLFLTCTASYGQKTVSRLFSDFSDTNGVERMNVGKLAMKFAKLFGGETMGVDGVEVLSFKGCEEPLKTRLGEAIRSLKDESYETLLTSNEEGNHTKILVKLEKDAIHELVVLTTGSEPALVRIKGKIKQSDINRLAGK
jgi:hypothetical protein